MRDSLLHAFLLGHEFGVAAEQDVGTAACHVGGDRDHALASGLRHNLGFALVILGIQHDVLDALLLQKLREAFGFFDRGGTHQHRLVALIQPLNLIRSREIFFFLRAINNIRILYAQQRLVGRDDQHFQPVNLVELGRFRFGRTGHAGELLVHAEVVLEGNRRQRLVFTFNLDRFLGFDRLVQTVRPPPSRHHASGELVDDDDFLFARIVVLRLYHVLHVAPVKRVRLHGRLDVMLQVPVLRVGNVANAQQLLDLLPAFVGDGNVLVLLIHHKVAGVNLRLARRNIDLFPFFQLGNDAVHALVLVGRFFARTADDQRRPRLIDQDGVHFVDDGVVVHPLHAILQIELHVVAQVVEAELVVGAVGDVGGIGFTALVVIQIVNDDADAQAEEGIELAHPLRVALGQVVVDRNHVHAAPADRVQIYRECGDQCFTFTGLHLGDLALVQHHAADQLHVEMPHVEDPASGLPGYGKRFHQQLVEDFFEGRIALGLNFFLAVGIGLGLVGNLGQPLLDTLAEFAGLGAQLGVRQLSHGRLERIDGLHLGHQALHFALVLGPENLGY